VRCFWAAFGSRDEDLEIHALTRGEELVAVVPCVFRGAFPRTVGVAANDHSPYSPVALADPLAAPEVIGHLLSLAPIADLGVLEAEGPVGGELVRAARKAQAIVVEEPRSDALIELPSTWEAFLASMSHNWRKKAKSSQKGLSAQGPLDFAVVEGGEALSATLEEAFHLEGLGWKGTHGSPIARKAATHRFYTELSQAASVEKMLALYTLRLRGELLAFELCLRAGHRIDALKISYRPDLARHSPGNVLRYLVLQHEIERGEVRTYHLGNARPWHDRWSTRTDPLVRLRVYSGAAGRFAYARGPALRQLLKRSSLLRKAVQSVRPRRRG
jgi:CelD/BcsL family acetyltransferase involved in cellulose biosynthesis